jgi:amidase
MEHLISREDAIYAFSFDLTPIATVSSPARLVFETTDALGGQIRSPDDRMTQIDFDHINPATGPVAIRGAAPGDALVVRIERIELPETGVIVTGPGMGVLGGEIAAHETRILEIRDGEVYFSRFRLPVTPMIGVIGVAPVADSIPTGTAHRHGGNMDTREVGEGAMLVLPVAQPGAMLALGDVHAVMGDGEVCVSACEVASRVTVSVGVEKGAAPPWPIVVSGGRVVVVVSLPDLGDAVREATRSAVHLLAERLSLSFADAYLLASLAVDVGISQLVDPNLTAKAAIPEALFGPQGFSPAVG